MFETLITPILMTMLYYLGCAGIVIGTGFMMLTGYEGYTWLQILIAGAASLLLWRIACEFVVVRFRMYEVLVEIRNQASGSRPAPTSDDSIKPARPESGIPQWARDNNLSDWSKE